MIAILDFLEPNADVPYGTLPFTYSIVIETAFTTEQIQALADAIGNIKEHADWGESISDFIIPDNWKSCEWEEKIRIVCEHMAKYVGFKIIDAEFIYTEVSYG